jgi:hypothetical protein
MALPISDRPAMTCTPSKSNPREGPELRSACS